MKVTRNNDDSKNYTLNRHELVKLINVGIRFDRWFDWSRVHHCDKDGFPILDEYDGYNEGVGDEPCLEFLLMKAGLYSPEEIPECAWDEMVDYNNRHESMDMDTWTQVYLHYIGTRNDYEYYGEENILDDVEPQVFENPWGRRLTDEESESISALKKALREEKGDKE